MRRRDVLISSAFAVLGFAGVAHAGAGRPAITLYKSPGCGCCTGHAEHLRAAGYVVTEIESRDQAAIKARYGVPGELEGCHTAVVGNYVVEGHVPAEAVDRLLRERPAIRGIALPGMPDGSPGMSGTKREPFVIYAFGAGAPSVFARL